MPTTLATATLFVLRDHACKLEPLGAGSSEQHMQLHGYLSRMAERLDNGSFNSLMAEFEELRDRSGLPPSLDAFNIVLAACAKARDAHSAKATLDALLSTGMCVYACYLLMSNSSIILW